MAFTLQDNDGNIDNANAYTDEATVRAYWMDRGVDLTAKTDAELEVAIVLATSYLDGRYKWVGWQRRRLQGTQWPRGGVTSFLRGLPPALITATCMMANRALSGKPLIPDPTFDPSGQKVTESTKKVGPIEVSLKFAESHGSNPAASGPQYPEVTLALQAAGLIGSGNSGEVARG
ncbi:virion structural protein [Xanthomonas phage Elanor]|uniref:Virion structural protein n=1 Tax=Xanthomonas phage Elanor TaxID=2939127 RepID=A0A9E7J5A3_9CAUD|nr:virion structural protein [Xanthomonas phage Elanor]URA07000.1 virion structural protein [Xanthomonas phage Elanor]